MAKWPDGTSTKPGGEASCWGGLDTRGRTVDCKRTVVVRARDGTDETARDTGRGGRAVTRPGSSWRGEPGLVTYQFDGLATACVAPARYRVRSGAPG